MKPQSIQIVPAQSGFFTVYDDKDSKKILFGEAVIAWRFETFLKNTSDDIFSSCTPLTVDGDAASNCIGIQNPDKTVTVFEGSTYFSLEELQRKYYPTEAEAVESPVEAKLIEKANEAFAEFG